jgi:hypothetical protein
MPTAFRASFGSIRTRPTTILGRQLSEIPRIFTPQTGECSDGVSRSDSAQGQHSGGGAGANQTCLRIPMKWGTDSGACGAASERATLVTAMISEVPHLSQDFVSDGASSIISFPLFHF